MSIVIGIDAGISSTKIIGIENGKRIMTPMIVKSSEASPAIDEVLDKYLRDNSDTSTDSIEHITLTGIGAKDIAPSINGYPTTAIDEFLANGIGARFDSGLDHIIVVSMGTGTSLVRVEGDDIRHIGGIGMGGGTLQGLARLLLGSSDMDQITSKANDGDADQVNLLIEDICQGELGNLTGDATASLFAKVQLNTPTDNDIAAGLIHMVLETIGSAAVLSQLNGGFKDFVLVGGLTVLDACRKVFPMLEKLYGVHFHIPKYAPYCTALGAALSYKYEND